jgi:hypothetical protein
MNVVVRESHGECATWRQIFGPTARLLAFAVAGECLDAPEQIPAGSSRSTSYGPRPVTVQRT